MDRCEYCGQEERYGHNAICVMNTVEDQCAEIERLRAPFRNADEKDWQHLDLLLGWSGHGQFWRAVVKELRDALTHEQSPRSEK